MTTTEIILIVGMSLVTFLIRYPMLVLVGRIELPRPIFDALKFVPVAVLTAICIPAMVMPKNEVWIGVNNAYLIGGIVAIGVAWRTKNLLLTIIVGMGVFLLWRALFPMV